MLVVVKHGKKRNPYAKAVTRLRHKVIPSKRKYKRKLKHKEKLNEDNSTSTQ